MANKRLLASVALAAGLLGGGAAGVILGAPGVSGAQTTTVPDQPTTSVPEGQAPADPGRAPRADRENCPEKDDQAPAGSSNSNSNAGFRRGPGGRV